MSGNDSDNGLNNSSTQRRFDTPEFASSVRRKILQEKACENQFPDLHSSITEFWSDTPDMDYQLNSWRQKIDCFIKKDKSEWQWLNGKEGYDYLKCPICNQKKRELSGHVKHQHSKTWLEVCEEYSLGNAPSKCQFFCDRVKGDKNPAYDHGGLYSPFSKSFIKGYDEDWNKERNIEASERMKNMETNPMTLSYWLKFHDGDEELAGISYSKAQTRDLGYFIDKYGEENGIRKHQDKTDKWIKSFKKFNYSFISQELFHSILEHLSDKDKEEVYFATYDREEMKDYKNKEFRLKLKKSYVLPDFIHLSSKKIIEFDGDYWHSEAVANPTKEADRDNRIIECGYQILHIKEFEYKKDPQKEIEKCINFLKESKGNSLM